MRFPLPGHISFETIAERFGTPTYVIDLDAISERIQRLQLAFPNPACDLFYSIKANPNREVMRTVYDTGIGVDACSLGDLKWALNCGFAPEQITFTGVALNPTLMETLQRLSVHTNLDSSSELFRWVKMGPGCPVGLRIAPGIKAGFSEHCQGGNWGGKLGIGIDDAKRFLENSATGSTIKTLHMHIGSGILDPQYHLDAVDILLELFLLFPQLATINIGGGFGTSYHDDEEEITLEVLATNILERLRYAADKRGKPIRLNVEPGEFIVAPAGYLLSRVRVKKVWQRGNKKKEALILDASMNQYPAGVLYGSMNRLYTPNGNVQPLLEYDIYGNTNQSGDRFGPIRTLPETEEGDLLIFGSAGAYSASRQSCFNEIPMAAEVVCRGKGFTLSTTRQTEEDIFSRMNEHPVWINDPS
jgi:diaminopimelate decarboxylase